MAAAEPHEPQVQVQFVTQLEERWRVTEAPIQLPTRLTRFGLSEVVNHLLNAPTPRPFDFLLQGELLRGPLSKSLARLGLSGEAAVVLEYIELVPPPQPLLACPHADWVSALAAHPDGGHLLSGCYDHAAYVWDAALQSQAELRAHRAPVKAVGWLPPAAGGALRALTASKDHTVRTWQVDRGGVRCEAVGSSHTAAVESLSTNPAGSRFCSGGWDSSVCVWSAGEPAAAADAPAAKRARGGGASLPPAEIHADVRLEGHRDCVSALCWPVAHLIYSASLDGSVREWDVTASACSAQLGGQKAALCVAVSLVNTCIATGHSDHAVRLWDTRLQQASLKLTLPHKGWVSSISWATSSTHQLLTSCHDGGVRLWDIRSTLPLHELHLHTDKALCATWQNSSRIVSGGADGQLRVAEIPSA
ncbi:hypothetical protein AB1Y20_015579 [Prymnesium parvum]|uniref:Ribosome biogenesis protein WDR12 homolog n=1 Tax=Prymnesium parvum TaxID=97485 RepID=A0AB34K0V2_PRYPA